MENFEGIRKLFAETGFDKYFSSQKLDEASAALEKHLAATENEFEKLFIMQLQSAISQACMLRNKSATFGNGAFKFAKGEQITISEFEYRPNKNGSGFCINVYYGTKNSEKVFIHIYERLENCYRDFQTLMLEFEQEIVFLEVPGETNMYYVVKKKF